MPGYTKNPYSEALEQAGQNILSLIMQSRQLGLQRDRLEQEKSEANSRNQVSAMNALIAFAPFLQHGKSIADLGFLHPMIQTAIPGFDPSDVNGLGGVVLNPETMQSTMLPIMIGALKNMSPEDQKLFAERSLNRAALGTPETGEELSVGLTKAKMFNEAWDTLSQDPQAVEGIFRNSMGLSPKINFSYKGKDYSFDTPQAAGIFSSLLQHSDQMKLGWANYNLRKEDASGRSEATMRQAQLEVAKTLMDQMKANNIILGQPAAMQIIGAYQGMVKLQNTGKLTKQNNPLNKLYDSGSDEMKASIEAFTGAVESGQTAMDRFFSSTPAGRQFLLFNSLGDAASKFMPKDKIPEFLEAVTSSSAFGEMGIPEYRSSGHWWGGGNTLTFRSPEEEETPNTLPGQEGSVPPPAAPTPQRSALTDDPDKMRQQMYQDALDYSNGKITASELRARYPDVADFKAVLQGAQELRKGGKK